jgi:Leucine-rich repeat (LRR) protein
MTEIKEYTIEDYFRDKNISLEEQKELTSIYCSNKQLTSLEGIENCLNLEYLSCSYNKLTSLNGIKYLNKLKHLDCWDNKLASLNGIENLTNLVELYCDDIDIMKYKDTNKFICIFI